LPEPDIAFAAKQPAHLVGHVTMIDAEPPVAASRRMCGRCRNRTESRYIRKQKMSEACRSIPPVGVSASNICEISHPANAYRGRNLCAIRGQIGVGTDADLSEKVLDFQDPMP
jgi:hypothetical protein